MNFEKSLKLFTEKEGTQELPINSNKGHLQQESPFFKFRRHYMMGDFEHWSFSFSVLEEHLDEMDIEQRVWKIFHEESEVNLKYDNKEDIWIKNPPLVEEEYSFESVRPNIEESVAFNSWIGRESYNEEENISDIEYAPHPKRLGRPPILTGLSKRKDVVLKALLRRIRTYFWKDLNAKTKYLNKKKYKGASIFNDCLTFYIENILKEVATSEFLHILGSFISSNEMKALITANIKLGLEKKDQKSNRIKMADEIHTKKLHIDIN